MITLDQIKQLDVKVRKAIDKINSLTDENKMLQNKLDDYQLRIEELEILMDSFKEDQGEIESGIIEALNQLKFIDDENGTPVIESEIQDLDVPDPKDEQEEESELATEEDIDVSETDPDKKTVNDSESNDTLSETKDNSDTELDIF